MNINCSIKSWRSRVRVVQLRVVLLVLCPLLVAPQLQAAIGERQDRVVSGTVVDQDGQPLVGVSVVVKGQANGTVTDRNGGYTIAIEGENAVLQFTFVGFNAEEIMVADQTRLDVRMTAGAENLEEVIVVGYGTQKKSDITGAVASIPKERLEMVPNLNVAQAIQGAIPGIQIQQTASGASPTESIMIRGRNSIQASNTPLIVVDGIPYGGALSDINPNDIQSIEILKDASAAAIYGSRGSNGVILITSMKGIESEPKITYNGYFAKQNFSNYPDYMRGDEFYDFKMIRFPGAMTNSERRIYEEGAWVDWTDLGTRDGRSHQHNLSVSGGGKSTRYYLSGNLLDVKGLVVNDDYQRAAGRINMDSNIAGWLTIGTQTQFTYDNRDGLGPDV